MTSEALAGCEAPEGAVAVPFANVPARIVTAAKERAGWLGTGAPFGCFETGPLFVWNVGRRWVVDGIKTGRHNCNFVLMAFDVTEDGLDVDFVAGHVSFYSDGLCAIARRLLTFQPGNGESFAPPEPAGAGGLY
jgi:hypothetical protein